MSPLNWKGKPYRPVGSTGYIRVYKPDINELLKPLSQKKGLGSAILTGNAINPQNSPQPQNVTPTPTPSFTPTNTPTFTPTNTPSVTPTEPYDIYLFEECLNPSNKFRFENIPGILSVGDVYYISGGTVGSCDWSGNTNYWSGETSNWDVCAPSVFNGYASVITYSAVGTVYSATSVTFTLQPGCPSPTPTNTPTNTNTPTVTPTNTPTPTTPFDSDAAAYLASVLSNGGTLDSTASAATNTLFSSLKSNSLYNNLVSFYPILGGVQNAHKLNGNLNTTYDLTYSGTWTHNSSGQAPNGTTAAAGTNYIIPNDAFSNSFGVYVSTSATTNSYEIDFGVQSSTDTNNYFHLGVYWTATNDSRWYNMRSAGSYANTTNGGQYHNIRTTSSLVSIYRNGVAVSSGTTSQVGTSNGSGIQMVLGALNTPTGLQFFSSKNEIFGYIATGLTTSQTVTLDGIINTFQTTIGRNTY